MLRISRAPLRPILRASREMSGGTPADLDSAVIACSAPLRLCVERLSDAWSRRSRVQSSGDARNAALRYEMNVTKIRRLLPICLALVLAGSAPARAQAPVPAWRLALADTLERSLRKELLD